MTFEKIPNTDGHIRDTGYRLVGRPHFDNQVRDMVGESRMGNWIDSLADGFGPIYRGSVGKCYLVSMYYWPVPAIPACWWEVEKC